jgi:demethylmenaquinone methyltransferase/2-methoxy-6-polyprenyl-1,4-benzoquinol methylase
MTHSERAYYAQRAPEYDDFYLGTGLYASRVRPGWHEEVEALRSVLESLSAGAVADVACGTGFLTRHLPGRVVGMDQSLAMLHIARARVPGGRVVQGDALNLPFPSGTFDCLSAGHYYGHLRQPERERFLAEARRVAARVLIIDAAARGEVTTEEVQPRMLNDGSHHSVYKRYFSPVQLLAELGGGRVLHSGRWFVVALG